MIRQIHSCYNTTTGCVFFLKFILSAMSNNIGERILWLIFWVWHPKIMLQPGKGIVAESP